MAGKKGMRDRLISSPTGIAAFRAKIKAAELRDALQEHGLGKREMSGTQIRAAEVLLRKCVPDLSQVDATVGGNLTVEVVQYNGK